MAIAIEVALRPDGELAAAFARLVPQLSSSSAVPDQDQPRAVTPESVGDGLLGDDPGRSDPHHQLPGDAVALAELFGPVGPM